MYNSHMMKPQQGRVSAQAAGGALAAEAGIRGFAGAWGYRGYVAASFFREFRLRYMGSLLGASLIFIIPAFQIALYVFVFGNLLKGRLPGNPTIYGYSIFLCGGLLFWNFFAELFQRTQGIYLDNANLIKKARFPRGVLIAIVFLSTSANLFLALMLLGLFLLFTGAWPGWAVVGLIPIWLSLAVLAIAIGLNIALLQVFFRDFGALSAIGLQALFWSTPIVYPAAILPEWVGPWLYLNPLAGPIGTVQSLLLGTPLPSLVSWAGLPAMAGISLLLAAHLHRAHRADLLDSL